MSKQETERKSIAVAIWLIAFLNLGNMKATGVLLPSLQDHFRTHTRTIGAAVSVYIISGSIIAILLVKPLARFFEVRTMLSLFGVISTLGMFICAVAPNTPVLVSGIFLAGISVADYILAMGAISVYFPQNYHVITSIVTSGLPLGIIIFTPMTQTLVDMYGWRGAMLILSAVQFHSVAASIVILPLPSCLKKVEKYLTLKDMIKLCLADICNISLISNKPFVVLAIAHLFLGYGFNGWMVYFISICLYKGLSFQWSAIVVLISGIGIFVTRISLAIVPCQKFTRHLLYIGSAMMTCAFFGMYLMSSIPLLSVMCFSLGVGYGIMGTMIYVATNACVDRDNINSAVAWLTLTEGIMYVTGGFVTGWLYDQTGSYNLSLIVLTLVSSLMVLSFAIEDVLFKPTKIQHYEPLRW